MAFDLLIERPLLFQILSLWNDPMMGFPILLRNILNMLQFSFILELINVNGRWATRYLGLLRGYLL